MEESKDEWKGEAVTFMINSEVHGGSGNDFDFYKGIVIVECRYSNGGREFRCIMAARCEQ